MLFLRLVVFLAVILIPTLAVAEEYSLLLNLQKGVYRYRQFAETEISTKNGTQDIVVVSTTTTFYTFEVTGKEVAGKKEVVFTVETGDVEVALKEPAELVGLVNPKVPESNPDPYFARLSGTSFILYIGETGTVESDEIRLLLHRSTDRHALPIDNDFFPEILLEKIATVFFSGMGGDFVAIGDEWETTATIPLNNFAVDTDRSFTLRGTNESVFAIDSSVTGRGEYSIGGLVIVASIVESGTLLLDRKTRMLKESSQISDTSVSFGANTDGVDQNKHKLLSALKRAQMTTKTVIVLENFQSGG